MWGEPKSGGETHIPATPVLRDAVHRRRKKGGGGGGEGGGLPPP